MIAGSVKPILVLAVGNQLLSDDGIGMVLLDELARDSSFEHCVEFVDGGTQGIGLLGQLSSRDAVVMLDAIALGSLPGTVHVLSGTGLPACVSESRTSHESTAGELLRFAALTGDLPGSVAVVGIEPQTIATGIGLSDPVAHAVPDAVRNAKTIISSLLAKESC